MTSYENELARQQLQVFRIGRNARLRARYDLSQPEYEAMFVRQKGVCAICHASPAPGRLLVVDHAHSWFRQVRGLLCQQCNLGLGRFRDYPALLYGAIRYLYDGWPMDDFLPIGAGVIETRDDGRRIYKHEEFWDLTWEQCGAIAADYQAAAEFAIAQAAGWEERLALQDQFPGSASPLEAMKRQSAADADSPTPEPEL
jgi:hypothetical protein